MLTTPFASPRQDVLTQRLTALAVPLVLAAYLALALAYSLATPILEGPDESRHLAYINHLVTHRQLPLLAQAMKGDAAERFQPPLYYALMATVLVALHGGSLNLPLEKNSNFRYDGGRGSSRFLHRPGGTVHSDQAGTFHLLRAVQIGFGLLTVYFTYQMAVLVLGRRLALAASLAMAGLPQFLHISAVLNNDNLANCLSALALLLLVKTWRKGNPGYGCAAAIGLVLGAALLTKLTTLFLLPVAVAVLARAGGRGGRRRWTLPALTATVAGVIGFWFPLCLAVVCGPACAPGLPNAGTAVALNWLSWKFAVSSFSGYFGWLTVPLDRVSRLGITLLWATGVVAAAWAVARRQAPRAALLLAGAVLVALVQYLYFFWFYALMQGRYLYAALPALASLWAFGLGELFRRTAYLLPALAATLLALNADVLVRLLPRLGMP